MRPPDLQNNIDGKTVKAWRIRPKFKTANETACIAMFLVEGPFHSMWDRWLVAAVHLRDIQGQTEPARKSSPDMTHEFQIMAIDPKFPREFDLDNPDWTVPCESGAPHRHSCFLSPADQVIQFTVSSDSQAYSVCYEAVKKIVDAALSPDSDFRSIWKKTIPDIISKIEGPYVQ